jgi:hypothetical protein
MPRTILDGIAENVNCRLCGDLSEGANRTVRKVREPDCDRGSGDDLPDIFDFWPWMC